MTDYKQKFEALVEHAKIQDKRIAELTAELHEVHLYNHDDVWFWQKEGDNYLESLNCPIVIRPEVLRELIGGNPAEGDYIDCTVSTVAAVGYGLKNLLPLSTRIELASDLIAQYGGFEGDHHKDWVIDQVFRAIHGPRYQEVVDEICGSEYEWTTGIAP